MSRLTRPAIGTRSVTMPLVTLFIGGIAPWGSPMPDLPSDVATSIR